MNLKLLIAILLIFSITAKKQLVFTSDTTLTVKILQSKILPSSTVTKKTESVSLTFGSNQKTSVKLPSQLPQSSILTQQTFNVRYAEPDLDLLRKLLIKELPMPQYTTENEKDKVVDNGRIDNGYTPILLSPQNAQAERQLQRTRWVFSDRNQQVTLTSKCFFNSCPEGEYTFYISSPCSYTIDLIGSNGLKILTIGSGVAFTSNSFKFNVTSCGRHNIKISSFCQIQNSTYYRFSLFQDRTNCYNCPDIYRHNYNPGSCKCECVARQTCFRPMKWYDYPVCGCGCSLGMSCGQGQYFDKKSCSCKCIPQCCPLFKSWNYEKCICQDPQARINDNFIKD